MAMTKDELVRSIELSLREADRLGLAHVGIKLNDAIIAMDGPGFLPLGYDRSSEQAEPAIVKSAQLESGMNGADA